jgi:hypothetical protein
MKNKFVLLTMTFTMLALGVSGAQIQNLSFDSAMQVARAGVSADRATIVSEGMNFNEHDGAAFWPLYRSYEYERSTLDDTRVAFIKEYTVKSATLNDADAKSMAEGMFEYDRRIAELKKKFFKKFNKVLPALTVAKFFQLDRRIDLLMDMKVESSLPPLTVGQPASTDGGAN